MTVKELIEKLQKCDENCTVITWDTFRDEATELVVVSKSYDKQKVYVMDEKMGDEV